MLGNYYLPDEVRPLTLLNTDNRLVASAQRHKLEPIVTRILTQHQQGFLHGRSMASNIVNTECLSMKFALTYDDPATILWDFQAAFPSLPHEALLHTLRHLNLIDMRFGC